MSAFLATIQNSKMVHVECIDHLIECSEEYDLNLTFNILGSDSPEEEAKKTFRSPVIARITELMVTCFIGKKMLVMFESESSENHILEWTNASTENFKAAESMWTVIYSKSDDNE